jgi:hypothetical protein
MFKCLKALLATSVLFVFAVDVRAQTLPCRSAGPESAIRITALKETLVRSDSDAVRYRTAVGTDGVDSASVTVVTDSTVCTAVTRSIEQAFHLGPRNDAFLVLRVGPRYVAFHPLSLEQSLFYVDLNYVFKSFVP